MILQRKKIWHIERHYHCSIIGTCLTDQDLVKLIPKIKIHLPGSATDYDIHSAFVQLAGVKSRESLVLHKFLDSKYHRDLIRFARINDDMTFEKLWQAALADHEIKGAYWAFMSHPSASGYLVKKVYGEVHMLNHKGIKSVLSAKKQIKEFHERATVLEEVLGNERRLHLETEKSLTFEIAALRMQMADAAVVAEENDKLQAIIAELRSDATGEATRQEKELLQHALNEEKERSAVLQQKHDRLNRKLDNLREVHKLAKLTIARIQEQQTALAREKQEQQQEMVSLETLMLAHQARACQKCEDCDTEKCPGPDLCGKTVLYVGGMHKMIPHYKTLVEQSGAEFIHHDGGREDSRSLLGKLLCRADAVLCPVDCVSHDACQRVKKMCKRYGKPFVMMRSSGLSALVRGLNEIVQ